MISFLNDFGIELANLADNDVILVQNSCGCQMKDYR